MDKNTRKDNRDRRAYLQEYYLEHKEQFKIYNRWWLMLNKDKKAEQNRRYREKMKLLHPGWPFRRLKKKKYV
jgi:hypothetical protein